MSEEKADIAIIGGGAAGLMAGISAADMLSESTASAQGLRITVLEKMPRPGRKIMLTGKGRCNLTNMKSWEDFSIHIHPRPNFLKHSFYGFPPEAAIAFFRDNGLETVIERGDRVFPASHLAADVVDTLYNTARRKGVNVRPDSEVRDVQRDGEGFIISLSSGGTLSCRKLIIATGGLSYPGTGSTGDGYAWAGQMGHKINRCFPSLTAIVPKSYKTSGQGKMKGHIDRSTPLTETGKALMGNQLKNILLKVYIDGTPAMEEFGDIDFTDGGIEGPVGFKVSRKCVNAMMNGSKVSVTLDMKPAVELQDLEKRIRTLWDETCKGPGTAGRSNEAKFRMLLSRLLPSSLIPGFMKCNPDAGLKNMAGVLKGWKFDIAGYVGYERCVITAGGVATDELYPKTMESKLVGGLYFAGEIIDMDGDTGGYNLQTAFSTGFAAGKAAASSL